MEPALKQRLIGAAVLVALAVIFLPMLIKGPAPESGASDVPLELPPAPTGEFETRELPLVTPPGAPEGGALGMPAAPGELPTVDTTVATDQTPDESTTDAESEQAMIPPPVASGDYAVSFGSYATRADAARVVDALIASQLPGYQETAEDDGRTLFRVRIGPYDSQASAEAARLRAAHVRNDVGAKVVVLDADAASESAASEPSGSAPVAKAEPPKPEPKPETAKPEPAKPEPVASTPKPAEPAEPVAAPTVGFAVQLGAFSHDAQAVALRDRARALGFTAFIEQVRTDKGVLNRVQVGPVADRAAAEQLKAQVAARMGISGFLQSHP